MFFSTYVLGKKGPLAKIWLAAHWDKKLTRNDVKVIDLTQTVVQIVQPSVPIALRTSGELLIGVVRIYALKVRHLLKDATDATMLLRAANVQIVRSKEGGKDSAVAVTMDLVAGRAENMLDADFDDIADILRTGVTSGNKTAERTADAHDVLGTAWFTAEPSQFLEENVASQGDDIARIRAEMRAFGRSESGSKSTSGSGSADKARAVVADGDNVLQLGHLDDMELMGAGNPDDLFNPIAPMEDMFVGANDEDFNVPPPPVEVAPKKKNKGISVDTTDTVLSKADFEAMMKDRSDIVYADARRGPVDVAEAEALMFIRTLENQRSISTDLFTPLANPGLRAAFAAAIATTAAAAATRVSADDEAVRAGDDAQNVNIPMNEDYGVQEDFVMPPMDELPVVDAAPHHSSNSRKRARDDDAFSASALGTLEAYRTHFAGSSSVSFAGATARLQRIDAARMFVDTLALASHGVVDVRQSRPFGEIVVRKTDLSAKPLVASA